ncbi:MAG TPA: PAS domain-containing sensor histidine kinase [Cryomorphaceae bacterium]|nr:PAS domain-containing sensor histidine kinase [Owenweeksia sp.]HAD97426.1 PAS domain-containing sensor histidine kinase [Cryomorphaceae bacterium]
MTIKCLGVKFARQKSGSIFATYFSYMTFNPILLNKERSRAEAEIVHRMITEIKDYAIIMLSPEGRVSSWNIGAEAIKGYSAQEIIGQSFKRFYTSKDLEEGKPEKLLAEARIHNRAYDEGWRKRKDGSKFWASVTITSIHDEDGNIAGYSKVTRDLTELKRATEKLQQHSKELEAKNHELNQFAYIASHDLQEPLNTVKSVISIMTDNYQGKLDETADQLMSYIEEATERMGQLIKGLLDFGRLGQQGSRERTSLQKLLEDVKADLKSRLEKTGARIRVGELPELYVYKTEIRLLFQNLISNGIKFHKKGSKPVITVSAEENGDNWLFCVKDNGIGIPQKFIDKLFMIFKRLPTAEEYEGTGIGLAHCKKIVDLHKGRIWVESIEGKGSSFYFTIPKSQRNNES